MRTSDLTALLVHPLARVHEGGSTRTPALVIASVLLVILGHGLVQPLPILDTASWTCFTATLPIRIAALQPPGQPRVDPLAWVERDEFRTSQAVVWLGRTGPAIHLVTLAYLAGAPQDVAVVVRRFGSEDATWSATIAPQVPASRASSANLFAYYLAVEIPRSEWRTAFPETGPYTIVAKPASDPTGTHDHGFCSAEATSWVFAVQP